MAEQYSRIIKFPRGKYIGRRVDDLPKNEAEHFYRCPACGKWGLTDDQEVRNQLIALAHDWIVAARKEEEEDDDDKVLVFPSAVERSRRHGLRMSLRHAGPRRLS